MPELAIVPKLGLGQVRFGMSVEEVGRHLGVAKDQGMVEDALELYYPNMLNCQFRDGRLFQIGATRRAVGITYGGNDIFASPPSAMLAQMQRDAGECFECWGFIVFPALGTSLTGFHDDDIDKKAVTIAADGTWDDLQDDFKRIDFLG